MTRSSSLKEQIKASDPRLKRMFQFGGCLLKRSNAKTARPLSTKHAMHIVLRSSQATGDWSLKSAKHQKMVQSILQTQAEKFGIKICEFANAGDHLHLLIKLKTRASFAPFIKALCGAIALKTTGTNKLIKLRQKFWDYRPWSRIVEIKKSYSLMNDEVIQEHLEKIGQILGRPRNYERCFRDWVPS